MNKKLLLLALALVICIGSAVAQGSDSQFSLFKRTIAPVMRWGENGIMTVPKATTLGKGNFFFGAMGQKAGVFLGDDLFLTSASVLVGTSDDVEFGYTRRQLILFKQEEPNIQDKFWFSDLSMDSFHLKARFLNLADYFIPQAAIGINAVSLRDNSFADRNSILFNPYIAVTSAIPIFTPKILLSITGVAETIMNQDAMGIYQFSGGLDLNLFDFLYGFAEVQGFDPQALMATEVVNAGVKAKLGFLTVGVGLFNIKVTPGEATNIKDWINNLGVDPENASYIAQVAIDIKLGGKPASAKK